ncbi:MAG: ABC transporter permease [Propionibacteriaceae bacterium]|jgi:branched-chain amino acid transport system permease protein|nr:ABC transporter permease [Propionibacteriaceae bacterium]
MLDTLIAGLIHGNAYALVAVGMSLIFGVTNIANFAHGSVFALGTMIAWFLAGPLGWPALPTILAVVFATALVGLVINLLVVSPLIKAPPISALLATLATGLILDNVSQLVFGPETRAFPKILPTHNLQLAGVRFGTSDLVMLGVTVFSMAALAAFLKFGKSGQAIRATSQDADAARQMGIPVKRIQNLSFLIASGLGGLAGVFVGLFNSNINPATGSISGLTAFVAATIGGLGSIPGAVVGGLTLGVLESVGVFWFGDGVHDIITFGVLLLVLVLRPGGLFGKEPEISAEPLTGTFLGGGRPIQLPPWSVLALVAAGLVLPFAGGSYVAATGTQVLAYAIAAVGLTLISGSAGQIILGAAGPIAIGAYTSALLAIHFQLPFVSTLILGGLAAAVLSSILTIPVWKLSGHYVAIGTIGVGMITVALLRIAEPLTRGSYGLTAIPFPDVFGFALVSPQQQYVLSFVVLLLALLAVTRIRASHLGKAIAAIGSDPVAARSLGIQAASYKALAYAVSAFFAGLAGALLAHQYTYIDPTTFPVTMSNLVLAIAVLGGLNSPVGAVLGSIVLVGAPELLRVVPQARIIAYGLVLILIIRFRPQGIFATTKPGVNHAASRTRYRRPRWQLAAGAERSWVE